MLELGFRAVQARLGCMELLGALGSVEVVFSEIVQLDFLACYARIGLVELLCDLLYGLGFSVRYDHGVDGMWSASNRIVVEIVSDAGTVPLV